MPPFHPPPWSPDTTPIVIGGSVHEHEKMGAYVLAYQVAGAARVKPPIRAATGTLPGASDLGTIARSLRLPALWRGFAAVRHP